MGILGNRDPTSIDKKQIFFRGQMFIWRLLTKNLANAQCLHRRINNISQNCSRCSMVENNEHIFFHCSFARAVWFASPFAMKSDNLTRSCAFIIYVLFNNLLSEKDQDLFFYILWFIWKARNLHRFQNKETSVLSIVLQAKAAQKAQYQAFAVESLSSILASVPVIQNLQEHHNYSCCCLCKSDASYLSGQKSGLEIHISFMGNQQTWSLQIQAITSIAVSPLHAEALSMYLGYHIICFLQVKECEFFSDNAALISYMKNNQESAPEWRLRNIKKDVDDNSTNMRINFFYIPWQENYIEDALARSSLSVCRDVPNISCSNINHSSSCPVKDMHCNFPSWAELCKLDCV